MNDAVNVVVLVFILRELNHAMNNSESIEVSLYCAGLIERIEKEIKEWSKME